MEFKGTKGDWKVAERVTNGVNGFEIHWSEDGECVTDHVYNFHDANLIASAPDLLKELINSQEIISDMLKRVSGGRSSGKTFLLKQFDRNKQAINKALK